MIFAAGFGTRMAPLTDTRPKPLIQVAGRTLLDHALIPTREAGLAPICVNAHYLAEQIIEALQDDAVTVLHESPTILDTGGGLKAALPHLGGESVYTMNSDAVWSGPNPFASLEAAWRPDDMDALVLCVPMNRAAGRTDKGDFAVERGRASRGPGHVYTGAQIIKTAFVRDRTEDVFSFNVIWDELISRDRLHAAIYPGHWCDVGHPSSIAEAEAMVRV